MNINYIDGIRMFQIQYISTCNLHINLRVFNNFFIYIGSINN